MKGLYHDYPLHQAFCESPSLFFLYFSLSNSIWAFVKCYVIQLEGIHTYAYKITVDVVWRYDMYLSFLFESTTIAINAYL